jgi:hypothetical protein
MDETAFSSKEVLRKEFKCRLQSNLHCHDHFLVNFIDEKRVRYQGTLLEMIEFIGEYWSKYFSVFLKELFKKPNRTSEGRRRLDHERIFNNILEQIEREETWHLNNDLTY